MNQFFLSVTLTALAFSTAVAQQKPRASAKSTADKPNIILVMVDDLGYSDFGAYGSEIQTPTIDKLAREGLRLREFYNNSICAPTRASLITGQYHHKAGVGYFNVNLGLPAYQGWLNKESLTFGEVLKQAGYRTYLSGKWHVGNDSLYWPKQRGFDRFYGFINGASNYYDISPYKEKAPPVELVEDNKRINLEPGKYLTDEITNHALSYINESKSAPFFLYLAYNAPHWPLQAPAEDIAKYKDRYAIGWDSLRKERLVKQIKLGIADPKQAIAAHDPEVVSWESLTYDEQQLWQRKMEVYAAMVDHVDQSLARLLAELKRLNLEDNTLIVLISDNGAQGGLIPTGRKRPRSSGPIGSAGSYDYQEQNWAYVSNTPFRNYKATPYEGGISAPFIAWYPKKIKAGIIAKGTAHLIDLAPTFYDLAGAKYPDTFNGVKTNPLPGLSLTNLLFQGTALPADRPIFWERAGNRAVRKGKWKIVSIFPQNKWQLFDLEADRGETTDLATKHPEIVSELNVDYETWAKRTDVEPYEKLRPVSQGLPGGNAGANQNRSATRIE
ncbi:sulfatase-like hydrolase/transferase [Spirosoma sp. HMF3257]|uniref:Arylsulfatase n=1 Tax=Spirosoma telluris TaxID=2183553 RepID=A0A327NW00_9BACT|nr:sulfatase-like hydrolase/transferase [Spirosoma telluris]RAI78024.1 arylsulfatase [Spirosoma telluris]